MLLLRTVFTGPFNLHFRVMLGCQREINRSARATFGGDQNGAFRAQILESDIGPVPGHGGKDADAAAPALKQQVINRGGKAAFTLNRKWLIIVCGVAELLVIAVDVK